MLWVEVDTASPDLLGGAASARPAGVIDVLRRPHVAATLGLAMFARLPLGASALLLLLRLTGSGANYAQAGAVAGCFGAGLGVGQPVLSRVIDRRGQPAVLVGSGLAGALLFLVLALIPGDAPLGAWLGIAALAGFFEPPIGSAMRGLWTVLVDRDEDRHVGFALDASAFEIVFTVGPLIFVGLIATLASPAAALAVGAGFIAAGSVALARSRPSRDWRPPRHDGPRSLLGALRSPGTITVLLTYLGLGGCFGSIEVALAAFGREHGSTTMISVLLALWSAGSVAGGLLLANLGQATNPGRRLVGLMATLAVSNAVLGFIHSPALLGAALVVTGATVAPIFATASGLLSQTATAGTLTEAFGWTVTATTIGMTIAAPAAGALIDAWSPSLAMSAAGLPVALAAAAVQLRKRTLLGPITPAAPRT